MFGLTTVLLFGLLAPLHLAAAPQAVKSADLEQYKQWMREARIKFPYPEPVERMYRVMMCESAGDRQAVGGRGRYFGLFQYTPGTWRGAWNPYRSQDILDAKAQIFATAKAWSIGMQSHWSCYRMTR
jgi:hypothetical protein